MRAPPITAKKCSTTPLAAQDNRRAGDGALLATFRRRDRPWEQKFVRSGIFPYQFAARTRIAYWVAGTRKFPRIQSMQSEPSSSDERNAEFMRLFVQYQRRIHGFITTLLPNPADAEDVLQETSITAWQKFGDYQPGTDFVRWVCTIARLKVLKFRREQKPGRLLFSDALLEDLADLQIRQTDTWETWNQALADCLAKLRPTDRQLVLWCSRSDTTVRQVASQVGRPENTVYKAIGRIRSGLFDCVRRAVSREDHER